MVSLDKNDKHNTPDVNMTSVDSSKDRHTMIDEAGDSNGNNQSLSSPPSGDSSTNETASSNNIINKDKEIRQAFPIKVYEMLEDADDKGFSQIVSWNATGDGFMVHEREQFIRDIVPNYFNQTRYKSFQRQLSLYGFQRLACGPQKGLRYHEKLRRGDRGLVRTMKPVGYKPRGPPLLSKSPMIGQAQATTMTTTTDGSSSRSTSPSSSSSSPLPLSVLVSETVPTIQDHFAAAMDVVIPMVASLSSIPTVISSNSLDKHQQDQGHCLALTGPSPTEDSSSALHQSQLVEGSNVPISEEHRDHVTTATSQLSAAFQEAMVDQTPITTDHAIINNNQVALFEGNSFYVMTSQQGAVSAGLCDTNTQQNSTSSAPSCETRKTILPERTTMTSSAIQELLETKGSQADQLKRAWEIGFRQAKERLVVSAPNTDSTTTTLTCQVVAPSPQFQPVASPSSTLQSNPFSISSSTTKTPTTTCTHSSHPQHSPHKQLELNECVDALDFHAINATVCSYL